MIVCTETVLIGRKCDPMEEKVKQQYDRWLSQPGMPADLAEELKSIAGNEDAITDRFYRELEFGTGGLRGVIGAGTNRMNVYNIRKATQGLANYLKKNFAGERIRVAIGHDSRNNSRMFAERVADIFASNGFTVFLFDKLRPTPELSFAIRELKCHSGVVVTASHNPKEYNGYKAYWTDGSQVTAPHDRNIIAEVEKITSIDQILTGANPGNITLLGEEFDEIYLNKVHTLSLSPESVGKFHDMKIAYTPLHGAGVRLVPASLRKWGFTNVSLVEEQAVIDGNFPTVVSPNPENPEGFYLAIDLAKKVGSDLILGTDPDSDRVGVMVRGADGEYHTITGNQMGVLLLDYIITAHIRKGTLPENAAALSTIVTSKMVRRICDVNNIHFEETFTGFKFMAEKLAEYQRDGSYQYLLAFEESYGYMMGDYVRDKDAVTACVMITEMAAYYFEQGMTLAQALDALYEKYGFYGERTLNLVMPGLDGLEKMRALMAQLRREPLQEIAGTKVVRMRDYQDGSVYVMGLGKMDKTPISGSNVLYFELDDGCAFIVRPSGTEPKIKVYILGVGATRPECDERVQRYAQFAETLRG